MYDDSWVSAATILALAVLSAVAGAVIGCAITIAASNTSVDLLKILIPSVLGFVGVVAGVTVQIIVHRTKANVDLYKPRAAVLDKARAAAQLATLGDKIDPLALQDISSARKEAALLFGRKVSDYLGETEKRMFRLGMLRSRMGKTEPSDPKWNQIYDDQDAALDWLHDVSNRLAQMTKHQMNFSMV